MLPSSWRFLGRFSDSKHPTPNPIYSQFCSLPDCHPFSVAIFVFVPVKHIHLTTLRFFAKSHLDSSFLLVLINVNYLTEEFWGQGLRNVYKFGNYQIFGGCEMFTNFEILKCLHRSCEMFPEFHSHTKCKSMFIAWAIKIQNMNHVGVRL